MAKKNFSTKEFNAIVKGAKVEVNGVFSNPFVIINALNKAYKGDYSKIAGACNFVRDNLKIVGDVLKSMHGQRYAFDASVLTKDNKGRFVNITTSKVMPIWNYQLIDVIPNKGYKYYKPIALTINAVFAAFCKVAKVEISDINKANKATVDAAKKGAKVRDNKIKALNRALTSGIISEFEYTEKLKAIKAA